MRRCESSRGGAARSSSNLRRQRRKKSLLWSPVTRYHARRPYPVPKKSAEDSSTGGEQGETVLSQPNKNERRIVVTSKGSLPITQRQQKRVSQAQKGETSQERPRTYHSRTFPKPQRTPQYRPTTRPQYKLRTTSHPTPTSVVDYESKQASTEQSTRGQASQVNHQSPPTSSLTSQESSKQEHRAAGGYEKRPQLTQRPSTGNTYEIRTPHSTQYVSIGGDAAIKGAAAAAARYKHYTDQQQQQRQQQQQAPASTESGYNSYDSSSYQSTTPVQSDQTNQGSGYSTDTQQDTYANQGYGPQDTRSVTLGASTQVSGLQPRNDHAKRTRRGTKISTTTTAALLTQLNQEVSQQARTPAYDSRYQTTPKAPRTQTTLYKYHHGTYQQDRTQKGDDGQGPFSPIDYSRQGNQGQNTQSITTPSHRPYAPQPEQHYGQAQSLGKTTTRSNTASRQPEPQYSKPAPPPLRSDFRATPKPDQQQGGGQLPLPPPPPTPPPQDAQVLLVEINNPQAQAQIRGQQLNAVQQQQQQQENFFQQRPLADLLANHQKFPLMQQLHFLGAAGPNQPLRVPIIEMTSPLLGGGNHQQGGPQLQNLRQEIQRQLQQLNQPHQQPFLFGQPHEAIQQMLKSQQLYVQQNQGVHKVITQGPVPIELRVEPLFDVNNKGAGDGGGIRDVRIQALKPIPLPASPHGHQGGPNDIPFEVNMLVDAAKKAIMSAGGFPKPEVIVVDGSQGGQMPENVLRAVQQILNSEHAGRNEHSRQPKGSASHHSQQKSHAEQPFPPPANVKLNDKLNNLIHGTGSSKLRYNEPVNVHIPVSDLPPRPAVDVRIRGPDGKVSQVLVPLHDAGPKEGLLLGGSAQEPAFGIGPVRLGEKVSLMDGAGGTLQIADLPQFDPAALAAAATDMVQFRPL
ncbi:hypothetical protein MTO96_006488 [Rhipicephalus appendiculatus]